MSLINDDYINGVNEILSPIENPNDNKSMVDKTSKKVEKQDKREKVRKSKNKSSSKNNDDKKESIDDSRNDDDKEIIKKKREELSIKTYKTLLSVKYKMDELKKFCSVYKISKAGNKDELTKRLYDYCERSIFPLKIQKVFRGHMYRKLHILQGPALKNRKLCTNDSDFFTMDEMSDVPLSQFISYKDNDGFVYGFNIVSLHNLILKEGNKASNPYNRSEFNNKMRENVSSMIKISKILKIPIEIEIKNEIIDPVKRMELKILELFQTMNSYGNYANSDWFMNMTKNSHIRFARELVDIWNYRALLTNAKKQEICPPHGTPFLGTPYFTNVVNNGVLNNLSNETIVKYNVQIIENLTKSAIDIDNKMLGTFYVLSALTLVSQPAREAMPWLYEAVVYIP